MRIDILDKIVSRIKLFTERNWTESYSQEGEDMVLRKIFEHRNEGFFVDVGAHHPKRFSNTYYFYKRGWRGINIDAAPGSMIPFNNERSEDINVEAAVLNETKSLTFYIFNEPALNTFDPELAKERSKQPPYQIIKEVKIETKTLKELLDLHLPENKKITFLTIDVEGLDLQVLQSNDWNKYIPEFVAAECFDLTDIEKISSNEVYKFLKSKGYSFYAKTMNTSFFKHSSVSI